MSAKEQSLANIEMVKIYSEALERYTKGVDKYGVYNPVTDASDLIEETIQELLDSITYQCMEIIKLRKIAEKLRALSE